jgi:hypothetical protein
MKSKAYFIGAKPIPLGSAKSKKKPKALRSLRLCLPYEIHANEERSEFHWGGE